MDVLEIIQSENQRIRDLFQQFKGETGKQQRKLLFENIRHDLELHIYAEEQVFYPAFKNYEEMQLVLNDLYSDDADLKSLLKALGLIDPNSVEFENKILELMNHFDDHVAREEGEFFSAVRKIMRRPERERVGRLFKAVQAEREQAA